MKSPLPSPRPAGNAASQPGATAARWNFASIAQFGVLALGLVPGLVLLVILWRLDDNGVSSLAGKLPTWDFTNLWAGGTLVRLDRLDILFDNEAYSSWLREFFHAPIDNQEWSYPPSMLLVGAPLSVIPLYVSYGLWTAGTLALLWLVLRRGGLALGACVLAIVSPAVLNNMLFGQNGAFTAALLIGALLAIDRRPVLAGVLMGLLTVKPQLGLLLPICLIASGNWRALIAAGLTALALVAASTLAFGWEAWRLFFTQTAPLMQGILEAPWPTGFQFNGISVFLMARAAGASLGFAYALQAVAALASAVIVWRAWRIAGADPVARMALTICLGLLATPYGFSYDLVAPGAGVAALIAMRGYRFSSAEMLAWLWPGLSYFVTQAALPLTAPVLAGIAWVAWTQLRPSHAIARA